MRRTNRRVFIYFFIGLCGMMWASRLLVSERVFENAAAYVMYPILLAQNKVVHPVKAYFEKRRSLEEFEVLVKQLQAEREDLIADNIQLQSLVSYANQTNDLSQFRAQYRMHGAAISQVLVKHFSDQAHYFLIDKGLNAGITQDMVAIYKNCLLGKVVEVYPQYSKVLLVTDRLCKVAAFCPHTRASGIHQGSNQERQTGLHFVSHLSDVDPDDLVLSSGDGLVFPKGFALGRIRSCANQGLFYDVMIEPLLDFRKINYCFIMQKGGQHLQTDPTLIAQTEQQITATIEETHEMELQSELLAQLKQEQMVSERIAMLQVEQSHVTTEVEASNALL